MRLDPARPSLLIVASLVPTLAGCAIVTPFGTIDSIHTDAPTSLAGRTSQAFPTRDNFLEQTLEALDDVGIRSVARSREDKVISFEGRTPSGRRANVNIRPEGARTFVSARFGPLGDPALTRAFFDRMAVRLGKLPVEGERVSGGPPPEFRADSATAPPSTFFQRRLEGGVVETPYP